MALKNNFLVIFLLLKSKQLVTSISHYQLFHNIEPKIIFMLVIVSCLANSVLLFSSLYFIIKYLPYSEVSTY